MDWNASLPLLLFVATATLTPGGATTLATASGAHFGFRRSVPLITGIAAGLASMGFAAAAGLATLLLAIPPLQLAMKTLGSGYLVWLAWRIARSGSPLLANSLRPTSFALGVWLVWHNPKGWAMTVSAAATFGAASSGSSSIQLETALGLAFGFAALGSLSLWCASGQLLASKLKTDAQWRALNGILGTLLLTSIIPVWWKQ